MSWFARLWNTFRAGRVTRDIDRELSFHLAERADQLRANGLDAEEAARRARRQFGNVALQAERTRDVDIALWMDALLRNLRYALRTLARSPGFTATTVATLALGIGANTAVFSALDAVLLQPLPFPAADRLVQIRQRQDKSAETNIAPIRLEDWNRLNSTFDGISGYFTENVSDTSGDVPERVRRAWVAPRFFAVWAVLPALGRDFSDEEHRAGGPSPVIISDRYWRRRLGADPNVLRRTVRIGSDAFPIVGVMPASFLFPDRDVDLWFPTAMSSKLSEVRYATWYTGIGRLKPGVTLEQARADMALVQAQLGSQHPETDRNIGVDLVPLKEATVGGVRRSLWLVFSAVSVLLLIACTNIAALLLSRAAQYQHEISVRLSLGATRAAVAGQVLAETGVLALAGGALGLLIAAGATAALRAEAANLPRIDEIALDGRILLYTLGSTLTVAFLCGVLPAIRNGREGFAVVSNEAGRAQVSPRNAVQWALVGTQVTLSVTLLAGAALLVRSFHALSQVDRGFEASRVLTFRVSGNWAETADYPRLLRRIDTTIEELRALPGVAAVATAVFLPGVPAEHESTFEVAEAQRDTSLRMVADSRTVSPEYFATLQIPVVGGQLCRRQPREATREVMVNRTFATRYLSQWPSAAGLHLFTGERGSRPARIAGIVGDTRERSLDRDPGPIVYPCVSAPNPTPYFLVRTNEATTAIATAVRVKMKQLEPLRAVYDIAPLEERIGEAFTENRLRTLLLVCFALTALLLACVGLYGTLSYAVAVRRREIGLRLALGARRGAIVRHFLVRGLRVAAVACVCGLALSAAFGRALAGMLYGVSPSDPWTLSGVVAIVLTIAALAALVPAARAALVEPMQVLRDG